MANILSLKKARKKQEERKLLSPILIFSHQRNAYIAFLDTIQDGFFCCPPAFSFLQGFQKALQNTTNTVGVSFSDIEKYLPGISEEVHRKIWECLKREEEYLKKKN